MKDQKQQYKNAMELLVDHEIHYQLKHHKLEDQTKDDINILEVATYALNRLTPLYASSTEGMEQQTLKGKHNLQKQIQQVVSLGFEAIQRDPLRKSTPLELEESKPNMLEEIKDNLTKSDESSVQEELTWIIDFMENFLKKVKSQKINDNEIIKLYYLLYYYWQDRR